MVGEGDGGAVALCEELRKTGCGLLAIGFIIHH